MKRIIFSLATILLCGVMLYGQDYMVPELEAALREDLMRCGGNLIPYSHGDLHETPAPCGYKPFYISHYGRHGSRHTWGGDRYDLLFGIFGKADSLGILSDKGRAAWREAELVFEAWNGMDGRLSPRGVEEHKGIAHRMVKRYPAVFKGTPRVRANCSTVPRCLVSMSAFTSAMAADVPGAQWSFDTGEKIMEYIGDTGTATPDVSDLRATLRHRNWGFQVDSCTALGRFFTDSLAAARIIPRVNDFNLALLHVATISRCWDVEDYILPEMDFNLLYQYYSYDTHRTFAKYGNAAEISRERLASAHLLVDDIVAKADEAVAGSGPAVDLRFGHDYPLHVLVAYLGVEGPGTKLAFDEVDKYWWQWQELCMASNLQMIFYRNKTGHVLVKFLYQEQERRLRELESFSGPYYEWDVVKANIEGFRR